MFEQIITSADPTTVVLITAVVVYVGKEIFMKKGDENKIISSVNDIGAKLDCKVNLIKHETTGALHNLENKINDKFTNHSDKFYNKISENWDKAEERFLTKEINKKQEERILSVEKAVSEIRSDVSEIRTDVSEIRPYLEQISMIFEMLQSHINNEKK